MFQPPRPPEPQFPFYTGWNQPVCPAGCHVALWTQWPPCHTWLPILGSEGIGVTSQAYSPSCPRSLSHARSAVLPSAHVSGSHWNPRAAAQTPEFRARQATGTLEFGTCPTSEKTRLSGGGDSRWQPAAHTALEMCFQVPRTVGQPLHQLLPRVTEANHLHGLVLPTHVSPHEGPTGPGGSAGLHPLQAPAPGLARFLALAVGAQPRGCPAPWAPSRARPAAVPSHPPSPQPHPGIRSG